MAGWDSDAVLRTVLESSDELIMLVGLDYRILYVNQADARVGNREVIGTLTYEHVPHDKDMIVDCLDKVARTCLPCQYETHRIDENGALQFWKTRVLPVIEEGVVTSLTLFARDVTKERRQEEERNRFFELSSDLVCTATLDGHFRFVTPSFTETLGFERTELLSRSLLDFVHPEDHDDTLRIMQSLGAGERAINFVNRFLTQDGAYRLIQWSGVFEPRSQLIHAVGRDITETRRLEEQLLQAQKLEVVGQLAGGVAHDFNNIILAVTLNAEMAKATNESPRVESFLGEVITASARASALTEQLLAFSRREVFNPEPLDVGMLIEAVYSMLRTLVPETISIEMSLGDEAFVVAIDRVQMEQVIMNLCLNSRDAMRNGTGLIRLSLEAHDEHEKAGVLLRVSDDGCGMSEEVRSRILEPFYTTKARGAGTGLGLVSVYTVIARHGGTLDFDSEPNNGTEMRVWLPRSTLPAVSEETRPERCHPTFDGETSILLAEDDPQVRRVVVLALESAGLRVHVAVDGQEAMRLVDEVEFDLAVLDLVMPKASGHDVFVHLRAQLPTLPVIFSTGYSDGHLSAEVLALEKVMLLRKPYRPDELMQAISRFIAPNGVASS